MSFSFGTPASAPATSSLAGGFSFGASKPATPGFGLTATSQPSGFGFGSTATTAAPAFGSGTPFGASATPAFGANTSTPAFGATSTPGFGAGTGFGATAAPAFGASTATPAFGATTAVPAFGATSAAPAFGSTTTPGFGATATPAFGATSTPAFGATSQPTFGATTATGFGQTSAPSFGGGLGTGGLNFGAGTSTASTGLSFGTPATSASTGLGGLGGFGFGAAPTTQSNFGFGATTATTNSLFETNSMYPNSCQNPSDPITQTFQDAQGPSGTPMYHIMCASRDQYRTIAPSFGAKLGATGAPGPQTSTAPSLGLGGLSQSGIGTANAATGDGKSEPPKQNKLPNEILTNVESFKEFVKKQKSLSSDIMRVSIKPLHKVSSTAESTLRQALTLSGEVARARSTSHRLRATAASALAHTEACTRDALVIQVSSTTESTLRQALTLSGEVARARSMCHPLRASAASALAHTEACTRDALGAELEGMAPPAYVKELMGELEQQILMFKRQMEVADKQMQSSPKLLTEQELNLGIRRMHEALVALAGRLQTVHTQVEAQKEQYLNLRKYVLKDSTDVFSSVSASNSLDQILRDAEGTRKKTKSGLNDSLGRAVLSDPRVALGSIAQLAGPTPFSYLGNSLSPFPGADNTGSAWQPGPPAPRPAASQPAAAEGSGAGFQLQRPPGKRGKQ